MAQTPISDKSIERALKRWFATGVTPVQVYEAISRVHLDCAATDQERGLAETEHCNDECEIDGSAWASRGDDGFWVHAWVWVRAEEPKDD